MEQVILRFMNKYKMKQGILKRINTSKSPKVRQKYHKGFQFFFIGQQKVAYLPAPDATKDKENKAQEPQAQTQSKEIQEKNGKEQNNEGKSKREKKDFTLPENSNVIDLT